MSTREMVDARHETLILEALDFSPSCQAQVCNQGNPAATHAAIHTACPCSPLLVCGDCAARLAKAIRDRTVVGPARCANCGTRCLGDISDWVRIEVLP